MRTYLLVFGLVLTLGEPAEVWADNLSTCLEGRYPVLCKKALLTPDQLRQTLAAEHRANLAQCLDGRYPSLCRHGDLTADEAQRVARAELDAALSTCLDGRYPALCRRALLTPDEQARVAKAEHDATLQVCLDGRYPALCRRGLLTKDEAARVAQAEGRARAARPPAVAQASPGGAAWAPSGARAVGRRSYGGSCETGHWVDSVMNDGGLVKLDKGETPTRAVESGVANDV